MRQLRLVGVLDGTVGLDEARKCVAGEASIVAQVAPGDELSFGVCGQPLAAPPKQFVNLVVADPVVLVVVEYRQQHEQMLQDVLETRLDTQRQVEVSTFAPIGECGVEGDA